MRKLDAQIPIKTLPEVVHALAHEITPDLQLRGVTYRDRRVKPSHVTAAMITYFRRMNPDLRAEIIRDELRELERLQDCDEYQRFAPPATVATGLPAGEVARGPRPQPEGNGKRKGRA